jgi:hypothetical protein
VTGSTGATGSLQATPLQVELATGSPTASSQIGLTIVDCTGYEAVLVNEGAQPGANDPAWQSCTTTPAATAYQLQAGGGYHSLHVWAKDNQGSVTQTSADVGVVRGPQMFVTGTTFTCALISGAVECWGDNAIGEMGQGTFSATPVSTPTIVPGLGSNVDMIAGGPASATACALQSGQVYCWGYDSTDQTGAAATQTCGSYPCSTSPQLVQLGGSPLSNVTSIYGGASHFCATVQDQSVVCWGFEGIGALGNGATNGMTPPVALNLSPSPAIVLGAGSNLTCFSVGGSLECAGFDYDVPADSSEALLGTTGTDGIQTCEYGYTCAPAPIAPAAVTQPTLPDEIALGLSVACMRFGGTVYCWGENSFGQLGNDTFTNSTVEVQVPLPGSADLVVAGAHHACARLTTGEVVCWGLNDAGQLGFQTNQIGGAGALVSSYPQIVPGLGRVAGLSAGRYQTCAALDSEIACWGTDQADTLLGQGKDTCASGPCSYTPVSIPVTFP